MKALDTTRRDFQENLRAKASKKRELVKAKIKAAPKKVDKVSNVDLMTEMREIKALLQKRGAAKGSVEFVVTERDENGKIKSFKVNE
jgi:hypothetical protein